MNHQRILQLSPSALLVQLPIPQLNFAKQTGNIPYGGACLKLAADGAGAGTVDLLPESIATYLGDAALMKWIFSRKPDVAGFTVKGPANLIF